MFTIYSPGQTGFERMGNEPKESLLRGLVAVCMNFCGSFISQVCEVYDLLDRIVGITFLPVYIS